MIDRPRKQQPVAVESTVGSAGAVVDMVKQGQKRKISTDVSDHINSDEDDDDDEGDTDSDSQVHSYQTFISVCYFFSALWSFYRLITLYVQIPSLRLSRGTQIMKVSDKPSGHVEMAATKSVASLLQTCLCHSNRI